MKNFVIGILICISLACAGFGIYYCVQYNNIDKNQIEDSSGYAQLVNEMRDTIKVLSAEKEELSVLYNKEKAENETNKALVVSLRANVGDLQKTVNELQSSANTNIETINKLNAQIVNLNETITLLNLQVSNSSSTISTLNAKIANLEYNISYYEQLLSVYQDETKVIATFKFDGNVYNVQVLSKGAKVSIETPSNTPYIQFNGWLVDGVAVDLLTYTLNENTTFVADITYSYDVKFVSGTEIINSQIVQSGNCAVLPNNPTKVDYDFVGWTLDGNTIVDPLTMQIAENTIFIAKFEQSKYTVVFKNGDVILSTQKVEIGGCVASIPNIDDETFIGWTIDGQNVIEDIENQEIFNNVVYFAKYGNWEVAYDFNSKILEQGFWYDPGFDYFANGGSYGNMTGNNYIIDPSCKYKLEFDYVKFMNSYDQIAYNAEFNEFGAESSFSILVGDTITSFTDFGDLGWTLNFTLSVNIVNNGLAIDYDFSFSKYVDYGRNFAMCLSKLYVFR